MSAKYSEKRSYGVRPGSGLRVHPQTIEYFKDQTPPILLGGTFAAESGTEIRLQ